VVDATRVAPYAVDLSVGDQKGFRREQDGFSDAVDEIRSNQKEFGARAGIVQADLDRLELLTAQVNETRGFLGPARKMVEILEETEASRDDERHGLMSTMAGTIELRAKLPGNEDLLARYETLRKYRSASAIKGVKTKRKNAQAKPSTPPETKPTPPETKPATEKKPG
jgi:hypothetical protein